MRRFLEPAPYFIATAVTLATIAGSPVTFAAQPVPHVTAQDALQAVAKRVGGGEFDKAYNVTSAMRDYCVAGVGTSEGAVSVGALEKMIGQQEAGSLDALASRSGSTFIMSRARGCLDQNAGRVARGSNPAGPGSVSPAVTFEGQDPTTGKQIAVK
jgi:hypothetical protein